MTARFLLLKTIAFAWIACSAVQASLAFETKASKAYEAGDYDGAEMRYQADVQKLNRRGKRDKTYSQALSSLGNIYYMEGKMRLSEDVYRSLVQLDEELYGCASLQVATDLYGLSRCLRRQSRWLDAEPILSRVLEIRRRKLGDWDADVSRSWLDVAVNYQRAGKFAEAEIAYKKAIAIRESLSDHDDFFLSPALRTYASLLYQLNRATEADALTRRADACTKSGGDPLPP